MKKIVFYMVTVIATFIFLSSNIYAENSKRYESIEGDDYVVIDKDFSD